MYYEPPDLQEDLSYEEFPAMIIAREVRKLRNREIPYVKTFWKVVDSVPTYGSHPENCGFKLVPKAQKDWTLVSSRVACSRACTGTRLVLYRYKVDGCTDTPIGLVPVQSRRPRNPSLGFAFSWALYRYKGPCTGTRARVPSSPERAPFAHYSKMQMERQLRCEARLQKKRGMEKKKKSIKTASTAPLPSEVSPPLFTPTPTSTTEDERKNIPLERTSEDKVTTPPRSTQGASSSTPDDPLSAILHSFLISSPSSNEGDDSSTVTISSDTQNKFDECLNIFGTGIPSLAQNPEQSDRLYALLLDLADQSDVSPGIKYFVSTLSLQLSSFLARQQSLGAELVTLDQHFHRVNHFKKNIPDIASPMAEVHQEDRELADQESALQKRISTLKEELAAAESTLAQTSDRRLQLRNQLKLRKEEGIRLKEELSQLYQVHPLMKRRRKAAETTQANVIAEWNQLRDLLS
uniref:Uncharacterized protein n=1 Tax=Ananas comosus var. bracteatus TaxID=296719 RepID=A0A6V7PGL6_ANACO|nr:unnamed protein product [Ananas comosus var. bracteatus]